MKRRRHAVVALAVVLVALLAQALLARYVARRDVLSAVVTHFDPTLVAALGLLLATRLFSFFLAPGWLLYVAARAWLERRNA
jgi:hypothetical protein